MTEFEEWLRDPRRPQGETFEDGARLAWQEQQRRIRAMQEEWEEEKAAITQGEPTAEGSAAILLGSIVDTLEQIRDRLPTRREWIASVMSYGTCENKLADADRLIELASKQPQATQEETTT